MPDIQDTTISCGFSFNVPEYTLCDDNNISFVNLTYQNAQLSYFPDVIWQSGFSGRSGLHIGECDRMPQISIDSPSPHTLGKGGVACSIHAGGTTEPLENQRLPASPTFQHPAGTGRTWQEPAGESV